MKKDTEFLFLGLIIQILAFETRSVSEILALIWFLASFYFIMKFILIKIKNWKN